MKVELLTKDETAERFGVDVRTIERWVQDGMPQRRRSGRPAFAWGECLKWREEQIRNDARATRHAAGDEDIKKQFADARLRTAMAEAEEAELNLAVRRGEVVPVEFMRTEFDRIAQALRTKLLALPPAWAARLGACLTTLDRQIALQDAIAELMPVLRDLADDDDDDDLGAGAPAIISEPPPDPAAAAVSA